MASIWIVDDVRCRPGMGRQFLDAYMRDYAPGAVARGMTLAHRMVEPAYWTGDVPNRITLVWAVPDAGTVWQTKFMARQDPSVERWWKDADAFLVSRERRIMADAEDVETLADV